MNKLFLVDQDNTTITISDFDVLVVEIFGNKKPKEINKEKLEQLITSGRILLQFMDDLIEKNPSMQSEYNRTKIKLLEHVQDDQLLFFFENKPQGPILDVVSYLVRHERRHQNVSYRDSADYFHLMLKGECERRMKPTQLLLE